MVFTRDPIINGVYQGIVKGIKITFDNDAFGSTLILIYAGIDAMATLDMPGNQDEVHQADYINWVATYLPTDFTWEITPIELYAARCAVLHNYGTQSRLFAQGRARQIGYMVGGNPPIQYNPSVSTDLVILDIEYLMKTFLGAVDDFLMKAYADDAKRPIVEERAKKIFNTIPLNNRSK